MLAFGMKQPGLLSVCMIYAQGPACEERFSAYYSEYHGGTLFLTHHSASEVQGP